MLVGVGLVVSVGAEDGEHGEKQQGVEVDVNATMSIVHIFKCLGICCRGRGLVVVVVMVMRACLGEGG